MKSTDLGTHRLALDPALASDLRARLRQDPQAGVQQAARQFEGMLLHLMLKSMRDASAGDGLLDSEQSRFFTAIGDQQMAQDLAAQAPLGFAALIEKQLARQTTANQEVAATSPLDALQQSLLSRYAQTAPTRALPPPGAGAARLVATPTAASSPAATASAATPFVDRVWPHALEASRLTGVPAHFLVAQAALETGWGKHEIKAADGSPSFNLFGIKAGSRWSGPIVEVPTTEVVNGQAQTVRARFRAYGSYAEAFRDYARLLSDNPRFAGVIGQQDGTQFARSLQQAGYATDPGYAGKLARIINGTALRQALAA